MPIADELPVLCVHWEARDRDSEKVCDRPRPKSRCKNLYAEVSEVSQGWIAKASSSREGRLARFGKMLKNAQQGDRVKRGDRSAVNQRGTTTVAEAARQFEQLRQVEDELMNQYRYRQRTTGGHQSGVERVWLSPCTRCVSNRDGGKLTGKRLEKAENEMMDLVRGDSRGDSKLKLDLTGRVGAKGRCCSRKQTKEGRVDSTRALTRSTLQVSFSTTSICELLVCVETTLVFRRGIRDIPRLERGSVLSMQVVYGWPSNPVRRRLVGNCLHEWLLPDQDR